MDRKKIIYIGIIFIITVITSITYFSYGFLTSKNEYHGRVNMIVGTLDYKINSADLDNNNSITLLAGESKKIEIEITSLNEIESKYELYYETESDDVEVGYSSSTIDNVTGTITSNGTKKVTAVLKNKSDSNATVVFGIQGGFTYNNITLEEGRIAIAEELNLCSLTPGDVVKVAGYTGAVDPFEVPCDGQYKIELWGAEGGDAKYTKQYYGGTGGYTSGDITLNEKKQLYLYVGGKGVTHSGTSSDTIYYNGYGYNGGGQNGVFYANNSNGGGGGGATDIRTYVNETRAWDDFESLKSRIMVAAGGGGADSHSATPSWSGNGGAAGGLKGYDANRAGSCYSYGQGASQTAAGISVSCGSGYNNYYVSNFGTAGTLHAGGGGGYYGGGASQHTSAGGGSSFISGYSGCNAISESSTADSIVHTSQPNHYSGLVFKNGVMVDGKGCNWSTGSATNCGSNQLQPNGTTATGHSGNGYARITYLGANYTITFNTNGGSSIENRKVLQGNTVGSLPTPTRGTDYFEGWYLESSFTTKVDSTYVPTGSTTLYARFVPRLYLYNLGNENTETTGGWGIDGYYKYNWNAAGTKYDNYFKLVSSSGNGQLMGTINTIDVTDYNKLYINVIDGSGTSNVNYHLATISVITDKSTFNYVDAAAITTDITATGLFELDISSITGPYYVSIWAANGRNVSIDSVWLGI